MAEDGQASGLQPHERSIALNVKVAYATHESPLPTCGGGVGGEGNGHDFHDRGCLEKS